MLTEEGAIANEPHVFPFLSGFIHSPSYSEHGLERKPVVGDAKYECASTPFKSEIATSEIEILRIILQPKSWELLSFKCGNLVAIFFSGPDLLKLQPHYL